jgi:hypothetical protein
VSEARFIVGVDGVNNPLVPVVTANSGFASPKSISFAPDFVSMMFPGFRSRCTIPCRCAILVREQRVTPEEKCSVQPICSVTDSSNALIPFQANCTPMHTRKNDDNCVITVIPVAPRIRANRSANP